MVEKVLDELLKTLDFTDTTKQLDELKHAIMDTPEKNLVKIQFLQAEIQRGSYEISSERIAARMIQAEMPHKTIA